MNDKKIAVLIEEIKKDCEALEKRAAAKAKKKMVVDAGLLKAGKSSLFNALAGKELFATDVVRATVENQKVELDGYILLDTPGLDARDEDTNVALEGYDIADVILFVHNLQEGEFSQREIDNIEQIADIFGDKEMFFKNVILVLTHKDQVEDHYESICRQISEQCDKVLGYQFAQIFCVDSVGYMKGLLEDKKLLMQDSGIPELQKAVEHCINDEFDLQQARLNKWKKGCIANIDKAIVVVRAEMPAPVADQTAKLKQVKTEMQKIAKEAVDKVASKELDFYTVNRGDFSSLASKRRGSGYSSESRARSAGVDAVDSMLKRANDRMENAARHIAEEAEGYVEVSGTGTSIKRMFSDAYENMREKSKAVNIVLKTNYDLVLKDFATSSTKYDLDALRSSARHIAGYSGSSYSSYIEIDYDYYTEYKQGIFGQREVQVKEYDFDAWDAMQEVDSDMREELNDLLSRAKRIAAPVFQKTKEDLCSQFNALTNNILKEVDAAIKQEEEKQKTANSALNQAKKMIAELESYKKEIEAL